MYKSPIELMQTQIETDFENQIITAVARTGIYVDKYELIKALQYDRNQYDKGFDDGRKETAKEILQEVGKVCGDYQWFKNLCKQFGVEVQ